MGSSFTIGSKLKPDNFLEKVNYLLEENSWCGKWSRTRVNSVISTTGTRKGKSSSAVEEKLHFFTPRVNFLYF